MKTKRESVIRGICILAVLLIHSLDGFDYSVGYGMQFVTLHHIINFAVATFIFIAGDFVNDDYLIVNSITKKGFLL